MNDLMPTDPSGTGTDWLTNLINSTANAYVTVKQADALRSQQLGQNGYYTNGQFAQGGILNNTGLLLLIGAGVLLFVLAEKA